MAGQVVDRFFSQGPSARTLGRKGFPRSVVQRPNRLWSGQVGGAERQATRRAHFSRRRAHDVRHTEEAISEWHRVEMAERGGTPTVSTASIKREGAMMSSVSTRRRRR